MKARIKQDFSGGLHWGQVYNKKSKSWETVTSGCLTKWGAMRELEKWKKVNSPDEFEI